MTLSHFYHGEPKSRSQLQRQFILLTQFPWKNRLLKDDANGLLAWVDVNHYFHNVVANLHTINDDKMVAAKLFQNHMDYLRFYKTLQPLYNIRHRFKNKDAMEKFLVDLVKQCQCSGRTKVKKPQVRSKNASGRKTSYIKYIFG